MYVFTQLLVAMIGASVVITIASRLWFNIRWHMFGWRPKIFDEARVTNTVRECAEEAVSNDARDYEETQGYEMPEDDKRAHLLRVQAAFRLVIERYIKDFSQKL